MIIQWLLYILLLLVTLIKWPLDVIVKIIYALLVRMQVNEMKKYAERTLGVELNEHNIHKKL